MKDDLFVKVDEVASDLGMSRSFAYKVIKELNDELKSRGFITISGRVSRKYYEERIYSLTQLQ